MTDIFSDAHPPTESDVYLRKRYHSPEDVSVDDSNTQTTADGGAPARSHWRRERLAMTMRYLIYMKDVVDDFILSFNRVLKRRSGLIAFISVGAMIVSIVWIVCMILSLKDVKPDAYGGVFVVHPYFMLNTGKIHQKAFVGYQPRPHDMEMIGVPCVHVKIEERISGVYEQRMWGKSKAPLDAADGVETGVNSTLYMISNVFSALKEMALSSEQRFSIPKMINFTRAECVYGSHEVHSTHGVSHEGTVGVDSKQSHFSLSAQQKPPFAPNMCAMYAYLSSGEEFMMVNPIVTHLGPKRGGVVMTDSRFSNQTILTSYAEIAEVAFWDWGTKEGKLIKLKKADAYVFQVEYDLLVNGVTMYDRRTDDVHEDMPKKQEPTKVDITTTPQQGSAIGNGSASTVDTNTTTTTTTGRG